jgi:acyl-CoA synthetase (AMP-forming)/AMP-acid ligase II
MEWLIDRFKIAPERIAFIHDDRNVSYKDIVSIIESYSNLIKKEGIRSSETVAVLGDYSPEIFCMFLALFRQASIVIPLTNSSVVEESLALAISGCEWYIQFDKYSLTPTIFRMGLKSNNSLLGEFCQLFEPGLILFSSGSSGLPKAILHNFNKVAEKFLKCREPIVAIPFLMIDHFGGINTILAVTSSLGTLVTVVERSFTNICKTIEKYKIELLPTTPSFLTMLLASNCLEQYDLSSLKRITYGTEVMPQTTLDRLHAKFTKIDLHQTYGLSEVGVLRTKSKNNGSVWLKAGGDGFSTKVINNVLWIKSEYSMVGYLNAPSEFDEYGWFNTNDHVEVDGEYIKILGRRSDIINVGGEKVYPTEIESLLLKMDGVEDVVVFAEENNMLGNIVAAKFVLNKPETLSGLKKRTRIFCKGKITRFKIPVKFYISNETTISPRGKKIRHI